MPDPTLPISPISPIRVHFRPYNHEEVQALLKKAVKDFGPFGLNGRRWWFETAQTPDSEITDVLPTEICLNITSSSPTA